MSGDSRETGEPPSLAELQDRSMRLARSPTRESWPAESALTPEELTAFLSSRRYVVLATTRPNGRPHAAPVAFLVRHRRVWMASVVGAARLRNLAHEPYASLVLTEGEGDGHVAVMIEGKAVLHNPEPILASWLRDAWRERFGTELDWAGTVIELVPERVFSYGRGRVSK